MSEIPPKHIVAVINPNATLADTIGPILGDVENAADRLGATYTAIHTVSPDISENIAHISARINEPRTLLVVIGGDGMGNLGLETQLDIRKNKKRIQEPTLTIIARGNGNDGGRGLHGASMADVEAIITHGEDHKLGFIEVTTDEGKFHGLSFVVVGVSALVGEIINRPDNREAAKESKHPAFTAGRQVLKELGKWKSLGANLPAHYHRNDSKHDLISRDLIFTNAPTMGKYIKTGNSFDKNVMEFTEIPVLADNSFRLVSVALGALVRYMGHETLHETIEFGEKVEVWINPDGEARKVLTSRIDVQYITGKQRISVRRARPKAA